MDNAKREPRTGKDITMQIIEDREFCLSILNCKDREEVKSFLASKGMPVNDNDIDSLADDISEIADICKKLDESELSKVVGGVDGADIAKKSLVGAGVAAVVIGGLGLLSVVAAKIKKVGDQNGWWNTNKRKRS